MDLIHFYISLIKIIRKLDEINDTMYMYKMEKIIFKKEIGLYVILKYLINKNDGVVISNDIDEQLIKDSLYEFIEYFVPCKKC